LVLETGLGNLKLQRKNNNRYKQGTCKTTIIKIKTTKQLIASHAFYQTIYRRDCKTTSDASGKWRKLELFNTVTKNKTEISTCNKKIEAPNSQTRILTGNPKQKNRKE
jgi:hypothetical protein